MCHVFLLFLLFSETPTLLKPEFHINTLWFETDQAFFPLNSGSEALGHLNHWKR